MSTHVPAPEASDQIQYTFLVRPDNLKTFVRFYPARRSKKLVVIVHGFGEHSGRYEHVAAFLNSQGWNCVAFDLFGHGQSSGLRGDVPWFGDYFETIDRVAEWTMEQGGPWDRTVLLGHSLGGLIGLLFAERHSVWLHGVVLTSPAFALSLTVPAWKMTCGRLLSWIWPTFSLDSSIQATHLSHDGEVVERYRRDAKVHGRVSARTFREIYSAMLSLSGRRIQLKVPLLLMQAGDDRLVHRRAVEAIYRRIQAPRKSLKIFEGYYHEILNEVGKDEVYKILAVFLKSIELS